MASRANEKRVSIVVLGDFGRSPRMQYHALSLSKHKFQIDVVAYKGSEPLQEITSSENIHLHYLKDVPKFLSNLPKSMQYILKTLWQSFYLFWAMMTIPRMGCILLQNPPAIPTLPVCWFVSVIRECFLFVDFHNYGYTVMAMNSEKKGWIVTLAEWCEKFFSRRVDKSICVTKAMKEDLNNNWNVRASVFYDCAPDIFHPISLKEKHNFFMKMSEEHEQFKSRSSENNGELTRFTKKVGNEYEMLPDRPALLVSSTSWTEDEDFSILLDALQDYELVARITGEVPDVLVCITGKGPLKSRYEELIKEREFSHVEILTLWLKFEDYPTILACADLGVSLHSSSSGLDLPMKVVDMFGCGLPVAAFAFNCIDELVTEGINGTIFEDYRQLSKQLQSLFRGFPKRRTRLHTFRENLERTSSLRWDENWNHTVAPLLREIFGRKFLLENC